MSCCYSNIVICMCSALLLSAGLQLKLVTWVCLAVLQVDASKAQCNNHGMNYPSQPGCQCYDCYTGPACEMEVTRPDP